MGFKLGILIFSLMSVMAVSYAHAEEVLAGSQYDEAKEAELQQKAKKRLYPGGRDEGDLKVQAQLMTPARKLAPQAEVKEESVDE